MIRETDVTELAHTGTGRLYSDQVLSVKVNIKFSVQAPVQL